MIRKPDRATNCPQLPRVSAGRTLPKRTIHSGRLPPRQTNDNSFGSGISNFPLATQDEIERARIRPAATLSNITHSTTTEQRCANCRGFRPTPTMCELPGFSPRCGDGRVAGVSAILTTLSAGRAGSAERAERPAGTWHRTAFRRGPSGPCRLRLSRAMPRGAGAGWTFAAPFGRLTAPRASSPEAPASSRRSTPPSELQRFSGWGLPPTRERSAVGRVADVAHERSGCGDADRLLPRPHRHCHFPARQLSGIHVQGQDLPEASLAPQLKGVHRPETAGPRRVQRRENCAQRGGNQHDPQEDVSHS